MAHIVESRIISYHQIKWCGFHIFSILHLEKSYTYLRMMALYSFSYHQLLSHIQDTEYMLLQFYTFLYFYIMESHMFSSQYLGFYNLDIFHTLQLFWWSYELDIQGVYKAYFTHLHIESYSHHIECMFHLVEYVFCLHILGVHISCCLSEIDFHKGHRVDKFHLC